MKFFLMLLLTGSWGLAWSQTNMPAKNAPEQRVDISSDSGLFDGNTHQMIYIGHVFVTDNVRAKLFCERFTVDVPPDGGHPTNILAETNVAIDLVDGKGQTNHITADKATYAYSVTTNATVTVTNETVRFDRIAGNPMPKVENPQVIILGEPLVLDVIKKQFGGPHYKMTFKHAPNSGNDTNASPFSFLK